MSPPEDRPRLPNEVERAAMHHSCDAMVSLLEACDAHVKELVELFDRRRTQAPEAMAVSLEGLEPVRERLRLIREGLEETLDLFDDSIAP